MFGSTSPELLTILQLQVELLRRSRKYADAEHVCQRALGISGAAYGPSDVQVAFWKNQLAQVWPHSCWAVCMCHTVCTSTCVGVCVRCV